MTAVFEIPLHKITCHSVIFAGTSCKINYSPFSSSNVVSHIEGKKFIITTPKTKNSNRIISMPNILVNDIITVYENSKKYHSFNNKWFVFGDIEPISNGKIRTHKVSNCKNANLKEIRIHDFRHSCASLLINNGASINMVAKYLGHKKIDETLNT